MILSQRPDASRVAGFRQWQERGRQVRKSERSIRIFGYATKKTEDENGHEERRAYARTREADELSVITGARVALVRAQGSVGSQARGDLAA